MEIRTNNLDEFKIIGDYIVDWNNLDYIEANIRGRVLLEKPKTIMLLYAVTSNIAYLNKDIEFETLLKYIIIQNNLKLVQPLPNQIIINITKSVYSKLVDGTLKPFQKKKRSILFNSNTSMSKNQKLEISRILLAEKRRNESISKIEQTIKNWNFDEQGKITGSKIANLSKLNIKTVEKYYYIFKDTIKEINKTKNPHFNVINNINYKDMGENKIEEDTSIYDNYNLNILQDIEKFIFDFNIKLHSSLKPKDFFNNPSYREKSNFDKAKMFLNSNIA